ncbi:hypothetical protein IJT10_04185 [bacterium]|nr:hypothetical protein [bacterium]
MFKFAKTLTSIVLLAGLAIPCLADEPKDISGMAPMGPMSHSIVTITDAKTKSDDARLNILTITPKGPKYSPVTVLNWSDTEAPGQNASDLEAICPVPDVPFHYYLFESGYWKGGSGRCFEIVLHHHPEFGWVGDVLRVIYPTIKPTDGTTEDHLQIEGATALRDGEETVFIMLGLRGDKNNPGQLVMTRLEHDKLIELERKTIDLHKFLPNGRSCSDIVLQGIAPNKFAVLVSGCEDLGDNGPFRSVICKVGEVEILADGYKLFTHAPKLIHKIDGLKVEALCNTPRFIEGSKISIGTDDENFKPVFRPLPENEK